MRRTLTGALGAVLLGLLLGVLRSWGQATTGGGVSGLGPGCQIGGPSSSVLTCLSAVSAGDPTNPGALDLTGTNGASVTVAVSASPTAYVIQLPSVVPVSTGLALKVSSISTTTVNGVSVPLTVLSWQ